MQETVRTLYHLNIPPKRIASLLKIHHSTVYRYLEGEPLARRVATRQDVKLLRDSGLSYRSISIIVGLSHTQCWRMCK